MIRSALKSVARRVLGRERSGEPAGPTSSPAPPRPPARPAPPPAEAPVEEKLEIEAFEVAAWRDIGKRPIFLDVREPWELSSGVIEGAVLVPMNQVPDRLAALPRDGTIIVYCAHGSRSYGVASYLREKGFPDAWSLVGGVGTWPGVEGAMHQPASDAAFGLAAPVRLTEAAATRLGRETSPAARAGTVQEVRTTPEGHRYVVGIGPDRVGDLLAADIEPIGRR